MRRYLLSFVPALAAALLLLGCGSDDAGVDVDAMANATYELADGEVKLTDGLYERPAAPDGEVAHTVELADSLTAFGDLDGDGVADGAAILTESGGGSGTFVYLAALVDVDGQTVTRATTMLADRVQVRSIGIADQRIALEMVVHGPEDPLCCPTQVRRVSFELDGDAFVSRSDELVGTVEPDS